jgi:hypothetical protein
MKRILSIFLIAFTVFLLIACGGDVEYKIYSMGQKDASVQQSGMGTLYSASKLCFSQDDKVVSFENTAAPQTKTLSIGENELTFSYEKSSQNLRATSKKKALQALGKVDEYVMLADNGHVKATFDSETGKLLYYSDRRTYDNSGNFTVEEAKKASEEFIKEQLGTNALDGFSLDRAYEDEFMNKKRIVVNYRKYLYGIETTEYIRVWFDLKGNVNAFNAENTHLFDTAKDELSEKKVKNAEKALLDALSDADYIQEERRLLVDVTTGIFYLEITADGVVYYINVN